MEAHVEHRSAGRLSRSAWRRGIAPVLVTAAILAASSAEAQRPDLRTLSCGQAQALLQSRGAVVMSTGRYTYDRFVAHAGYCIHGEITRQAWVATGDNAGCVLGFRCEIPFPRFQN